MATQQPTETKGDGGQQPAVTRQSEEQMPSARPVSATRRMPHPMAPFAMMRRMLDELDQGGFGWRPGSMMRRMFEDMESMFEELGPRVRDEGWAPRVEVRQHENHLVVSIDLPGVSQDQITISADDGELVVEGERPAPSEQDELLESERAYGRFRRVIQLPQGLDADRASARFENGVLEISIALPETHATRKISIGDGEERREQTMAEQPAPAQTEAEQPAPAQTEAEPQPEAH